MKKKILIVCLLVVTLFLLIPSIPAIQTDTIKEEIKQNLQEDEDDCDRCPSSDLKLDTPNEDRPICDLLERMCVYYTNRWDKLVAIFRSFIDAFHFLPSIEIITSLMELYLYLRVGPFIGFSLWLSVILRCSWIWG